MHNIHDCYAEWVTSDQAIMHVQFDSDLATWQPVLKRVVNTSNVDGSNVNTMCLEQIENRFRVSPQVFANNDVKLHYFLSRFW